MTIIGSVFIYEAIIDKDAADDEALDHVLLLGNELDTDEIRESAADTDGEDNLSAGDNFLFFISILLSSSADVDPLQLLLVILFSVFFFCSYIQLNIIVIKFVIQIGYIVCKFINF